MCKIGPLVVSAVLVLAVGTAAPRAPRPGFDLASRLPALSRTSAGNLGDVHWIEQIYMTSTNEPVDVGVSPSYPSDQPIGQRWADFFAALPHGPELARLRAYIAPLHEVPRFAGQAPSDATATTS